MKFLSLSKNKTFVEKLLNHRVNMLVLMLTFTVLTRKSVSFTLDNKETFETVTSHCTHAFRSAKDREFNSHYSQLHLNNPKETCGPVQM